MQAEDPSLAWNLPGSQGRQSESDTDPRVAEYVPVPHCPEQVKFVAPSTVSVENVPGSQPVHALDPVAAAYEPTEHSEQVAVAADVVPAGPYMPAAQGVPVQVAALISEYFPAGHSVQRSSLSPADVEYFPAPHCTQSDSASFPVVARYLPAAQSWQAAGAAAPGTVEYFPASQSTQSDKVVLPVTVRYLPAEHEMQVDPPVAAEYLPAAHPEHDDADSAAENLPATHSVQAVAPSTGFSSIIAPSWYHHQTIPPDASCTL